MGFKEEESRSACGSAASSNQNEQHAEQIDTGSTGEDSLQQMDERTNSRPRLFSSLSRNLGRWRKNPEPGQTPSTEGWLGDEGDIVP